MPADRTGKISLVDFINSNDPANNNPYLSTAGKAPSSTTDTVTNIKTIQSNVQSSKVSLVDFINQQNSFPNPVTIDKISTSITNVPYPRFS